MQSPIGETHCEATTPESVTELEEHLRETIDSLHGPAINEHESFVIATMRMGPADSLAGEFGKVNAGRVWRRRLAWMTGGYVGGVVIGGLISGTGSLSAAAVSLAGFSGSASGISAVAVMAACWIGLFACLTRFTPAIDESRFALRRPIGFASVLVLALVIGTAMYWSGNVIESRSVSINEFGQSMMWRAGGAMAINLGVFVTCIFVMLRLGRDPVGSSGEQASLNSPN